jgi:hypothetical protein
MSVCKPVKKENMIPTATVRNALVGHVTEQAIMAHPLLSLLF